MIDLLTENSNGIGAGDGLLGDAVPGYDEVTFTITGSTASWAPTNTQAISDRIVANLSSYGYPVVLGHISTSWDLVTVTATYRLHVSCGADLGAVREGMANIVENAGILSGTTVTSDRSSTNCVPSSGSTDGQPIYDVGQIATVNSTNGGGGDASAGSRLVVARAAGAIAFSVANLGSHDVPGAIKSYLNSYGWDVTTVVEESSFYLPGQSQSFLISANVSNAYSDNDVVGTLISELEASGILSGVGVTLVSTNPVYSPSGNNNPVGGVDSTKWPKWLLDLADSLKLPVETAILVLGIAGITLITLSKQR